MISRSGYLIASVLGALAASPAYAELSPEESAMAGWIAGQSEAMEALLERTVNINSGTMNFDGVREVGRVMRAEYDALGFETEWIDQAAVDRAGHLFARSTGGDAATRRLLLIGHLDTVFERDDAFQKFERAPDGRHATAPGAFDMKAGNVIMLYALKALAGAGLLDGMQIVVALTGDEEAPGRPLATARARLIEAGRRADYALGFENASYVDGVYHATIARRSSSKWVLEVTGLQAHSSQIFSEDVGAGAIFEASRILSRFYDEVRGEDLLTFNAGNILGGTEVDYDPEQTRGTVMGKTNVVPRTVTVHGGIRTITDDQLHRARQAMLEIVAASLPHTSATITFDDGYPPMAPTDGNIALQRALSVVNQDLGGEAISAADPGSRGAADVSFVAPYADAIDGLGAGGSGAHSPAETVDLDSLPLAAQRAAILIYRLAHDER